MLPAKVILDMLIDTLAGERGLLKARHLEGATRIVVRQSSGATLADFIHGDVG